MIEFVILESPNLDCKDDGHRPDHESDWQPLYLTRQ